MNNWKVISFCVVATSLLLSACGGDGISDKWDAICDKEITATNCPENMDNSVLVMFCKAVGSSLLDTDECNTKIDTYTACYDQRKWACLEGGEVPTIDGEDPCAKDVVDAFAIPSGACIDQTKVSTSSSGD
ncbi:MAG: hypothetical protein VYA34_05330 [Myxococcota bacterium]|nr:hypothetical protein [Myxococcota bacterium]